ncbi:MAG: CBS domain-containing protein [Saprospiraceae bacterium]|nr:CBS domain-containing protein [Saprospiraceae bacterium]
MKNFQQKQPQIEKTPAGVLTGLVTEYMARDLITFSPDTAIIEAIETLVSRRISGAPVLNDKREVVGMVDDKDCLRVLVDSAYHNHPVRSYTVSTYMDKVMRSIPEKTTIVEAANIFLTTTYKRLLVVDAQGKLVGQISRSDVLRAIRDL